MLKCFSPLHAAEAGTHGNLGTCTQRWENPCGKCVGAFLSAGGNEAESETVKIIVDGVTYLLHYVMAFTL